VTSLRAKLSTGVYWGRFNPPHKGHLRVIRKLTKSWNLVVAIGSSEHRDERRNPFSGAERKRMMESYLKELEIRGVRVVSLKDGRSEAWAIDNLIKKCKPDVVFLSNEKRELAKLARQKVRVVVFRRTGRISSTQVRDSIASGEGRWTQLTGRSVAKLIVEVGGIRRIRRAYRRKDSD
jgi:nicotinamide-nucleotide adenylyltransferase